MLCSNDKKDYIMKCGIKNILSVDEKVLPLQSDSQKGLRSSNFVDLQRYLALRS